MARIVGRNPPSEQEVALGHRQDLGRGAGEEFAVGAAGAGAAIGVFTGNGTEEALAPFVEVVVPSSGDLPASLNLRRD
jgi:hypothetical protein